MASRKGMDMRRILLTLSTTEETQAPGFSRGAESELLQVRQTFAQSMHQNISVRTYEKNQFRYLSSIMHLYSRIIRFSPGVFYLEIGKKYNKEKDKIAHILWLGIIHSYLPCND